MAIVNPIIDQAAFDEWVASRPPLIQQMIRAKPPDRLYRLVTTGQRCTIHSYAEDGTVRIDVTDEYNCVLFSTQVFGIAIDSLEECDPPAPDELLGDVCQQAGFSEEQIKDVVIPALKNARPNQG